MSTPKRSAAHTLGEASRSENRPGRNRTCNPRFGSALPATPALQRLLILKGVSSAPPTPALLDNAGVGTNPGTEEEQPAHSMSEDCLPALAQLARPARAIPECKRASGLGSNRCSV